MMKKILIFIFVLACVYSQAQVVRPATGTNITSSADLISALGDETGTGYAVFNTAPTFASTMTIGTSGGTSGQINFVASDNDQGNININTYDKLMVTGFYAMHVEGSVYMSATKLLAFDGGNDTYILESSADVLDTYIGAVNMLKITENGVNSYFETPNGFTKKSVTATITAGTTQSQGQVPLTKDINEVATVGTANDVVTLPTAAAGMEIFIINNGANTLQIFPASGDDLGAGANASTTLAAGSNVTFVAYNLTNWETK